MHQTNAQFRQGLRQRYVCIDRCLQLQSFGFFDQRANPIRLAASGDGWADNIYYGEHDAFECGVCDGSGDCPVCEGEGVWIIG